MYIKDSVVSDSDSIKTIDKIVVFYSDNSFEELKP